MIVEVRARRIWRHICNHCGQSPPEGENMNTWLLEQKARHVVLGLLWLTGGFCAAAVMIAWTVHFATTLG
jgi:hypothetical protein